MFKKITVLAMALGALAAFALPMSASGAWTKHDNPIQASEQIAFDGKVKFKSQSLALPGGIECDTTAKAQFVVGTTTGTVDQFALTPPKTATEACVGSGNFKFCQQHTFEATGLSGPVGQGWVIHTTGTVAGPPHVPAQVTITTGLIHAQVTGQFCPVQQQLTVTPFTAHLTPDNPQTTNTVTVSGTTQIDFTDPTDPPGNQVTPLVPALIEGSLNLEVQNTYGI